MDGEVHTIGSAGGVTATAYGEQVGFGWIRFVGGPAEIHNQHLRAPWCARLLFDIPGYPLAPSYRLTVVKDPTGAVFMQYQHDWLHASRLCAEMDAANRLWPISDLERKLFRFQFQRTSTAIAAAKIEPGQMLVIDDPDLGTVKPLPKP